MRSLHSPFRRWLLAALAITILSGCYSFSSRPYPFKDPATGKCHCCRDANGNAWKTTQGTTVCSPNKCTKYQTQNIACAS